MRLRFKMPTHIGRSHDGQSDSNCTDSISAWELLTTYIGSSQSEIGKLSRSEIDIFSQVQQLSPPLLSSLSKSYSLTVTCFEMCLHTYNFYLKNWVLHIYTYIFYVSPLRNSYFSLLAKREIKKKNLIKEDNLQKHF